MVNISSQSLSSNSGAIGAATGLMQGLQAGYIKGRELSQQENLLRLQQEAGQRAEQGLNLERQRLGLIAGQQAFEQTEVQRRVTQEEKNNAAAERAGPLIALTGDSSGTDAFVARQMARVTGIPRDWMAGMLSPGLRAAHKSAQVDQFKGAISGADAGTQDLLWKRFGGAAKESEEQRGRQQLAEDFADTIKRWNTAAAEIGEKTPSYLLDMSEVTLKSMREYPESYSTEDAHAALQDTRSMFSAWYAPRHERFILGQSATKALDAVEGIDPRIRSRARQDIFNMSQGLVAPEELSQDLPTYLAGRIPVKHGGRRVAEATSLDQEEQILAVFQRHDQLSNDLLQAQIDEANAQANYWNRGGAGTGARGEARDVAIRKQVKELMDQQNNAMKADPVGLATGRLHIKSIDELYSEAESLVDRSMGFEPGAAPAAPEDAAAQGFSNFFQETMGVPAQAELQSAPAQAPAPQNGSLQPPATGRTRLSGPQGPPSLLISPPTGRTSYGLGGGGVQRDERNSALSKLAQYARNVGYATRRFDSQKNEMMKAGAHDAWVNASQRLEVAIAQFAQFYGGLTQEELDEIERTRSGNTDR